MRAITLRNISHKLQEAIERRAREDGLSFNEAVLRLLEDALGLGGKPGRALHHDLDHLAGTWSQEEADELDAALAEQRQVDPERRPPGHRSHKPQAQSPDPSSRQIRWEAGF